MRPARSAGPRSQESLRIPLDPRNPRPEPTFGRFAANGDGTTGTSGGLRRLRAVLRRPSETPPPLSAGSILIPGESRRPSEGRTPAPAGSLRWSEGSGGLVRASGGWDRPRRRSIRVVRNLSGMRRRLDARGGRLVPTASGYPWDGVESQCGARESVVSERDSLRWRRRLPRSRHTSVRARRRSLKVA